MKTNLMMTFYKNLYPALIICILCFSCEQRITLKESGLTAINPLSYTDVIYKAEKDTVLTASFDGKIRQIVKGEKKPKLIIDISDEVYSLAYNKRKNLIYATTLNSGIVVIDEEKAIVERRLPLKEKWARKLFYDPDSRVLMTSDYAGNSYLWQTDNDYKQIPIPDEFAKMIPMMISKDVVYFDGKSTMGRWDMRDDQGYSEVNVKGEIVDIDNQGNALSLSHTEFMVYNTIDDSLMYKNKHPDWPIYVARLDTTMRAPVSLHLTNGLFSENNVYTSSVDRSIRK
ncbi:MAG TPA: hypothetical protein VJ911_08280, partial [Cryomorphaceae bacterium]|nr:hypothetical protein [Cryomorphaceae bacterium]